MKKLRIKFNWGTGLVLTLGLFMAAMIFVMVRAGQQNFDLVSEEYYALELAYEEQIQAQKNAQSLSEALSVSWDQAVLKVNFPKDLEGAAADYRIHFYNPAQAKLDQERSASVAALTDLSWDDLSLASGRWQVKVHLNQDGKKYYYEPTLWIP